ncbi:hypothetical protein HAX54_012574 [Datura stramonium]|uniref:Uncharacterized protein n=1 Tax=Datura stramonium TaxID=4076 RepID=A0ABS8Y5I5_DATST|nr:hypothetical protein [Datura stramonium]
MARAKAMIRSTQKTQILIGKYVASDAFGASELAIPRHNKTHHITVGRFQNTWRRRNEGERMIRPPYITTPKVDMKEETKLQTTRATMMTDTIKINNPLREGAIAVTQETSTPSVQRVIGTLIDTSTNLYGTVLPNNSGDGVNGSAATQELIEPYMAELLSFVQ